MGRLAPSPCQGSTSTWKPRGSSMRCKMNLAALSPAVRAAAERFERETGRRLVDNVAPNEDEAAIGLFLILNGYLPNDEASSRLPGTEPSLYEPTIAAAVSHPRSSPAARWRAPGRAGPGSWRRSIAWAPAAIPGRKEVCPSWRSRSPDQFAATSRGEAESGRAESREGETLCQDCRV
jgi:hypothetical protein